MKNGGKNKSVAFIILFSIYSKLPEPQMKVCRRNTITICDMLSRVRRQKIFGNAIL